MSEISTRGSGTVLLLGITMAIISLGGAVLVAVDLVTFSSRIQQVANLAALAASDIAIGVVPGEPCNDARALVSGQALRLVSCATAEGVATAIVSGVRHGLEVEKTARARPTQGEIWPAVS